MLNAIKQLKQQNEVAFNFALAGVIALLLAMSGLLLLWHGLIEQRQIAKQVGDLQMRASRIETIVINKKLAVGEEKAFLEFEGHIKNFNQQWTQLKQQHNYSDKTIKEVDVVWQRINSNAQIILAKKKDMMTLRDVLLQVNLNFKAMYKMNDNLISVLLIANSDKNHLLLAKELTLLLLRVEKQIHFPFLGDDNAVCACDSFDRESEEIAEILNGFWAGDSNLGIEKIDNTKVREIIEKQIILYKKIHSRANTILQMTPEIFQVREAQVAIYRDNLELKSALAKLNSYQLNKALIGFVVCVWLAFFACVFGFLRALNTKHID